MRWGSPSVPFLGNPVHRDEQTAEGWGPWNLLDWTGGTIGKGGWERELEGPSQTYQVLDRDMWELSSGKMILKNLCPSYGPS